MKTICLYFWIIVAVIGCLSGAIGFVAWSITWDWAWYFYAIFYGGLPTIVIILWSLAVSEILEL